MDWTGFLRTKYQFLRLGCVGLLNLFILYICTAATMAMAKAPHIVVIMADDAGWNDFGFTRGIEAPETELIGPQAITPNIDALAKGGITLANHYAYRYCSPSRAAFLTGRLPFHVHEHNPGIRVPGCTNLNYTMLPAKLAEAGYVSYHVGTRPQFAFYPPSLGCDLYSEILPCPFAYQL